MLGGCPSRKQEVYHEHHLTTTPNHNNTKTTSTLLKNRMSVALSSNGFWQISRQSVIESSWVLSRDQLGDGNTLTPFTYQAVHFGVFFQHEVERQGGKEDNGLYVVKVGYPVRPLQTVRPTSNMKAAVKLTTLRFPPTS